MKIRIKYRGAVTTLEFEESTGHDNDGGFTYSFSTIYRMEMAIQYLFNAWHVFTCQAKHDKQMSKLYLYEKGEIVITQAPRYRDEYSFLVKGAKFNMYLSYGDN